MWLGIGITVLVVVAAVIVLIRAILKDIDDNMKNLFGF